MGKIIIIDYNVGNIRSVENALRRIGAEFALSDSPEEILSADHVILPGVGNAAEAMRRLREKNLVEVVKSIKAPVLGICVGMQLMCSSSEEGNTECMGIFDLPVKRFAEGMKESAAAPTACGNATPALCGIASTAAPVDCSTATPVMRSTAVAHEMLLKIPNMGWSSAYNLKSPLFKGIAEGTFFYFVHSYYAVESPLSASKTDYGVTFSSSLYKDNFYGTQFHPEKSGEAGSKVLKNFLEI